MDVLTKEMCKDFVHHAADGIAHLMEQSILKGDITAQDYMHVTDAWAKMRHMIDGMECFWKYVGDKPVVREARPTEHVEHAEHVTRR